MPSALKKCKYREKGDVTLFLKCAVMLELSVTSSLSKMKGRGMEGVWSKIYLATIKLV